MAIVSVLCQSTDYFFRIATVLAGCGSVESGRAVKAFQRLRAVIEICHSVAPIYTFRFVAG